MGIVPVVFNISNDSSSTGELQQCGEVMTHSPRFSAVGADKQTLIFEGGTEESELARAD